MKQNRKVTVIINSIVDEVVSITEMKYGWSKHGGARYGMEKDKQDWCCQACGKPQPAIAPQYMMPLDSYQREFARICSVCKHIQWQSRIDFYKLIKLVRPKLLWDSL